METAEERVERKKVIKKRLFYLFIALDILLAMFLVFEIIYAIR